MKYSNTITLLQQFHIPKNEERYQEIKTVLKKNIENKHINHIYLLNERKYTKEELGLTTIPNHLHQVIIDTRLSFYITFKFAQRYCRNSWVVLSNNDIYFDNTVLQIPIMLKKQRHKDKSRFLTLLRYEVKDVATNEAVLYKKYRDGSPKHNCQDTWAFYTNELPFITDKKLLNIQLGRPGCDNRIAYVLHKYFNYQLINVPSKIKSYHYHSSQYRTYSFVNDPNLVKGPYIYILPN